jgi:hypothetical protein
MAHIPFYPAGGMSLSPVNCRPAKGSGSGNSLPADAKRELDKGTRRKNIRKMGSCDDNGTFLWRFAVHSW